MTTELYDRTIMEVLQKAVTAAVVASSTPGLPVSYLGRNFLVPNDQKWLEIVIIPNNRTDDFWGNEKNYQGLFRLILHWPKDDQGIYEPIEVLASVCAAFDKSTPLQNVRISGNPDFGGMLAGKADNLYPARLRYTCFRT